MASLSDSTTMYDGADVNEWMAKFRLQKLKPIFDELGLDAFEDLLDLYSDDSSVQFIKSKAKTLDYSKFVKAAKLTSALIGQEISPFLAISESSISVTSTTSISTKFDGNNLMQWLAHFKLTGMSEVLHGIGVGSFEDLAELYADEELMAKLRSEAKALDFKKFKKAAEDTTALKGIVIATTVSSASVTTAAVGNSTTRVDPLESPRKGQPTTEKLQDKLAVLKLQEDLKANSSEGERKAIEAKIKVIQERQKNIVVLKKVLREAASIDLCILMDCTTTMRSYMDVCKRDIAKLVDRIKAMHPDIELRLSFVGYRDHCDKRFRFATFDFASNCVDEYRDFVGGLTATGGGDFAEDVHGGLKVVWPRCVYGVV